MKSLICIPTYNERDNVQALAKAIIGVVPEGCEILFIDDASPDGTGALLDEMIQAQPLIHVLHRQGKQGLATAYIQGFQWGLQKGFDWIFEMDADFSHDVEHLKQFFSLIDEDKVDAICGSRYIEGGGVSNWSEGRVMLSRMGSLYSSFWLRFPVADWTGGFNAWSAQTLKSLKLESIRSKGYAFQIELKYRTLVLGLKLVETPIIFRERRAGQSKMSGSIVKEALLGVARIRYQFESDKLF